MSLRPFQKTQESRRAPKSAFLRSSQKSESPATSASSRGSPLRQPFESRTKHVRKYSSSLAESFDLYRLARGRWSASFRGTIRARGVLLPRNFAARKRERERDRKRKKRKKKKHARLTRVRRTISARDSCSRAASERSCVRESVLCRRRSPRVCRDVELAGVFWFRRDFPRGTGEMVRWEGSCRRRRFAREACACRHCATWGTPVAPLSPSVSCDRTR